MDWEWKGNDNKEDASGLLILRFSAGNASVKLPSFGDAHYLAQLIHKEVSAGERRGADKAVQRYTKLGKEITDDA